ncbi:MAG: Fur family transcriptional regulator [Hyphomicrobiaceae bacterium]
MARHARKTANGTRPPPKHVETVLAALRSIGRPASAYDIQAVLAEQEHLAPQTIYRALQRLIEAGSVHKVESLNAFVVCSQGCHRGASVFAICECCGVVSEMRDSGIETVVETWSHRMSFAAKGAALELHGVCANCAQEALR